MGREPRHRISDGLGRSGLLQSWPVGTEPSRDGYMLCASPRSGSTLLCDMLSRTGVAGAPASYLRPASIAWYSTEWRVPASQGAWDERYLAAIRHHSANGSGCPALRIMWSDMPAVLARLQTIDPTLISDRARVQHLLGIEHFVHLRRNDRWPVMLRRRMLRRCRSRAGPTIGGRGRKRIVVRGSAKLAASCTSRNGSPAGSRQDRRTDDAKERRQQHQPRGRRPRDGKLRSGPFDL
jgi:hypothetical protein